MSDERKEAQQVQLTANEELLSLSQAARTLGLTYLTLWNWAKQGQIDAMRLPGGQWRIRRSTVERMLRPAEGERKQ